MERRIEAGIRGTGLENFAEPLTRYAALVLLEGEKTNLTGAKTPEALLAQILDSLALLPYVAAPLVDLGSGAGFPAIPIAIVTGIPVTLVEARLKKARFLERALREMGIAGEVVAERAEVAARSEALRDRFASGSARAVAGAPTTAELILPFIRPGGRAIMPRGRMSAEEREALADAALVLGAELERVVPADGERRVCILRKTGLTPERFPRRTGIPAKRPLCV